MVEATTALNVPTVDAELAKIIPGLESGLVPELFNIVRLLNADVPIILPKRVCGEVPFKKMVPELCVNIPEFM